MAITEQVLKSLNTGKVKVYLDGDPMPYMAEITLPKISHDDIELDNSSVGGKFTFADPSRFFADGKGTITFEATSSDLIKKLYDSSTIYNMSVIMAVNAYSAQVGKIIPLPMNYKVAVQFSSVDEGSIKANTKREIQAEFSLFAIKIEVNYLPVIDIDFASGLMSIDNQDMLQAVTAIVG